MKICFSCFVEKEESDFFDGRNYCKECIKEKLESDNYVNYLEIKNNQKSKAFDLKMLYIKEFNSECAICGYKKNVSSLDFHHLKDKKFSIGAKIARIALIGKRKYLAKEIMEDQLKEELKKCILLCKNCHSELHHAKSDI